MYIQFDYQGMNFDALENLPYGAKEIKKDLYIDTNTKRLYYYIWGNANAYRYQYINMRVKSIDGVEFLYANNGALSSIRGMNVCNIIYSPYRLVSHINGINFIFDDRGNLLTYKPGINQANLRSEF